MPITLSAKKKLRQDKKRELRNARVRKQMKLALRETKRNTSPKNIKALYAALDTASKKHLIHENKAARLKSRLTKHKLKTQMANVKSKT